MRCCCAATYWLLLLLLFVGCCVLAAGAAAVVLAAVIIFGATGTVGRQMLDYILGQNVMGDNVKVCTACTARAWLRLQSL